MNKIIFAIIATFNISAAWAQNCDQFSGIYNVETKTTKVENPQPSDWKVSYSTWKVTQANCSYLETRTGAPPNETAYGFIINNKFNEVYGAHVDRLVARAGWADEKSLFVYTEQFTGSQNQGWKLIYTTNQMVSFVGSTLEWEVVTRGTTGRFISKTIHQLTGN